MTIATKVSATGSIYGSVGSIQIADELAKLGHNIDRKIIVVKDNVKEVGHYKAIVKLHKEVSVEIPFEVVAEEAYFADSKREGEGAANSFDSTFGTMPSTDSSSDFEISSGDDLPF